MNTFKTSIPVHYYELNSHQEVSPVAMLNYLEEAAIRHSKNVGFSIEKLLSLGKGWILNRWSVIFYAYPKWNEDVHIETWPFKFERFYATREFKITDSYGNLLGKATSLWILLDLNRKRPVRIPPEISETYGTGHQRMINDNFDDLPNLENIENELVFRVRLSDIDTYNHVNNARYAEWVLESVPLDINQEYQLNSIEIEYKKETNYGSTVKSLSCEAPLLKEKNDTLQSDSKGHKLFMHKISDRETDTDLAIARTTWIKR